jgi:hypothetical protein
MPVNFTIAQILAMAPDDSSARAGQELVAVHKWVTIGCNDSAAWGECQGSGSRPYQTRIDLVDVAFKCSCPSRKFPCKHSLGLFLMLAQFSKAFQNNEPPPWVTDWLADRQSRAEKKIAKEKSGDDKAPDPAAHAKRVEQRLIKVEAGVTELRRFIQDAVRQGLATLQNKPYDYWEGMAARLVDAQAPGLARFVRDCAGVAHMGSDWQERLLEKLSRLHLLTEAYSRLETLPIDLQDEVRSLIGFTVNQEDLLKHDGTRDTWEIIGQKTEQEDKLKMQRTWLKGVGTGKFALILHFAHGSAPLDHTLPAGSCVDLELVYFPGAYPLRALVKKKNEISAPLPYFKGDTIDSALDTYSAALGRNPWIEKFPMVLGDVVPLCIDPNQWSFQDGSGRLLPVEAPGLTGWQMMIASGGAPVSVFGEWDGNQLTPFSMSTDKTFFRLT